MARPGEPKSSVRHIAAVERRRQALELRKAGFDYRAIASKLGYRSPSGAHDAVMAALAALTAEPATDVRALELARLDVIVRTFWPKMLDGDEKAADRVFKAMERRAAYLGLDAPAQVNLRHLIEQTAGDLGLDPAAAVDEAERIVAAIRRDGG